MDKKSGQTHNGKDVQREDFHVQFDSTFRPLHGKSHQEMKTPRSGYICRRTNRRGARAYDLLASLEADSTCATGEAKADADSTSSSC